MKLRTLLLAMTAICLALGGGLGLFRWVTSPVIPDRLLDQLVVGTPDHRVRELLGEPSWRSPWPQRLPPTPRKDTRETWVYEHAWNPDWIEVGFDAKGLLLWVDAENVVPRHQLIP